MRDYDPTTGRYIQADPLGLVDGASVYGYVRQNPGRWTDPRGEEAITLGTGIGATVGSGGAAAGAVVGGGIVGVLGILLYPTTPGDGTMPEIDFEPGKQCTSCPPCKTVSGKIVPVGTVAYRPLDSPKRPQHGIVGPHHNIYQAQQNPMNCRCFWKPIGAVSPANLPAGAIPIEPFAP